MENEYYVQTKGIKDNKNCWTTKSIFDNLDDAIEIYNSYTGGCCKRILRMRTIKQKKVLRLKKY